MKCPGCGTEIYIGSIRRDGTRVFHEDAKDAPEHICPAATRSPAHARLVEAARGAWAQGDPQSNGWWLVPSSAWARSTPPSRMWTVADRDREAAEDGAAIWRVFPKTLAEIVASERAAATAACAEIASEYTDPRELRGAASRECALLAGEIEGRIRALSPEGWVGVRREDLETLREAAEAYCKAHNPLSHDLIRDEKACVACRGNKAIRAALARGKGE